jgi:CheY-like chemotaxis protein
MNPDVERSDEAMAPPADKAAPPVHPADHGQAGRRVLVVDDDPDAAEALAELLSMSGHEVRSATAADEAMRLFEALQPQVAVLDIGMPAMDGYELQARLRELRGGRDCIYVALTGYGMQSEQEQSRKAGFRAHFVKPVCLAQLVALIEGPAASADPPAPGGAAESAPTAGDRPAVDPKAGRR